MCFPVCKTPHLSFPAVQAAEQFPTFRCELAPARRRGGAARPPRPVKMPPGCGVKAWLIESAEWRATATSSDPATAGFHISQVYSSWSEWRDLLARHEAARTPETQQVFVNCSLGRSRALPIMETPAWEVLMARAEPYPEGDWPVGEILREGGHPGRPGARYWDSNGTKPGAPGPSDQSSDREFL